MGQRYRMRPEKGSGIGALPNARGKGQLLVELHLAVGFHGSRYGDFLTDLFFSTANNQFILAIFEIGEVKKILIATSYITDGIKSKIIVYFINRNGPTFFIGVDDYDAKF